MRTYYGALLAILATLLPIAAWTQENPATPSESRVGVMRMTGMVGFVSSIGPSQIELTLLEHVIFTVHIGSSTQITENGQPASLSKIRTSSALRVHGAFNMQAHTVEAEAIEVLPPSALRLLEFLSENFLKTWTVGTVTDVQPDSVVLQRLDGALQTIQLGADTSYVDHAQPVTFAWLGKGQRVEVEFSPSHPPLAGSIRIQGMVPQTLNARERTKPKVEAERLSKPSCQYCPNPEFPKEAKKDRISSARALFEITVSEKGDVDPHDIRVVEDPGHGFTEEAIVIVKKWKFEPATDKNGKPAKTRIPVEFTWHSNL